jgi:hypothetical protein
MPASEYKVPMKQMPRHEIQMFLRKLGCASEYRFLLEEIHRLHQRTHILTPRHRAAHGDPLRDLCFPICRTPAVCSAHSPSPGFLYRRGRRASLRSVPD